MSASYTVKLIPLVASFTIVFTMILSGCGSSRETESGASATETLHTFEAEFDPTKYNPDVKKITEEPGGVNQEPVASPVEAVNPPPAELVQGFRVQLYASTSIDQTAGQKQLAEELFPAEWFYMVYDPPTYKLRGGNFLTRFEADRFQKELKDAGFRDSWIVPDRVVKDSGPRTATTPENE